MQWKLAMKFIVFALPLIDYLSRLLEVRRVQRTSRTGTGGPVLLELLLPISHLFWFLIYFILFSQKFSFLQDPRGKELSCCLHLRSPGKTSVSPELDHVSIPKSTSLSMGYPRQLCLDSYPVARVEAGFTARNMWKGYQDSSSITNVTTKTSVWLLSLACGLR